MSEIVLHSSDFGIKYLKQKNLQELIYERAKEDLSDLKSEVEGGGDVKIDTAKIKDYLINHSLTLNGANWEFKKIGGEVISKDYASVTYVACIQLLLKKWSKSQATLSGQSNFRVDGIFGPRTKDILQQYSQANNLQINSSDFYKAIVDHLVANIDTIASSANVEPLPLKSDEEKKVEKKEEKKVEKKEEKKVEKKEEKKVEKKEEKKVEKDQFKNTIKKLQKIINLPDAGWTDAVVYDFVQDGIEYRFYSKGRVYINKQGESGSMFNWYKKDGSIVAGTAVLYAGPNMPIREGTYGFEIKYEGAAISNGVVRADVKKKVEALIQAMKNNKTHANDTIFDVFKSNQISLNIADFPGEYGNGQTSEAAKELRNTSNGIWKYNFDLFSYPSIEEHIIAIQEQMKTYDIRAIATTKQKVDQKNKAKINTFVRKNVSSIKDVPLLPSFPRGVRLDYQENNIQYGFFDNGRVINIQTGKKGNYIRNESNGIITISIVFDDKTTVTLGKIEKKKEEKKTEVKNTKTLNDLKAHFGKLDSQLKSLKVSYEKLKATTTADKALSDEQKKILSYYDEAVGTSNKVLYNIKNNIINYDKDVESIVASLTNLQKLTTESAAWNTKYNALQTKNPKKEEKKQVEKKEEKKQVEINGNLTEVTAEGIKIDYVNAELKKEYQEEVREFSKQLKIKVVEGKKQRAAELIKTLGINVKIGTYSRYDTTEGDLKNNTYHYRTSTKVGKMNVEQNVNELVKQLK